MKAIKGYIIDVLEKENRMHKRNLTKNRKALKTPHPISFTVKLVSYWNDYGERDFSATKENIEDALISAIEGFLSVNNRTDVQADCYVMANLQNGVKIDLPEKHWESTWKEIRATEERKALEKWRKEK